MQRAVGDDLVAEFRGGGLGVDDRAGLAQCPHSAGVAVGHIVGEGARSPGGSHPARVQQILHRHRDARQRTQIAPGRKGSIDGIRVTPEMLVKTAEEKKVHIIGLSILSGSHVPLVREVMQRIEVARLPPLAADLAAYLQCRATAAGRKLDEFITPDGVDELRARLTVQGTGQAAPVSLLYPLNVNNWMAAALNTAADLGAPHVDRDVIRAV